MAESIDHLLDRAADHLEAGRKVALCVLVRARGSTPAAAGATMLIDERAEMLGTIGGGCVEAELRRQAMTMLTEGQSGLVPFKLDHDYGWDDGLLCGGSIDVAVTIPEDAPSLRAVAEAYRRRQSTCLPLSIQAETGQRQEWVLDLPPRPQLLIAGAGHLGSRLARLALELDFSVAVFDDRPDLLDRFVGDPARRVSGPMHETITAEPIDQDTYIVIVTRGHRHDERVLRAVVEKPAGYIGMIGSRRKVKLIFDDLRAEGIADAALSRVHAPVGLRIGAVTVSEIALSIAAHLVEVRREGFRSPVRGPLQPGAAGR